RGRGSSTEAVNVRRARGIGARERADGPRGSVSADGGGRGRSAPLGATAERCGVNFSVFSRDATFVGLLLFERDAASPCRVIPLPGDPHRRYHYWPVGVPGIGPGQLYGYRAYGPFDPARGLRCDPHKLLLDPYALAIAVPDGYRRAAARSPGENAAVAMKSIVADPRDYDWEGDRPLRRPCSETVIYELHVRGFTVHPSSGAAPARAAT